MIIKLDHYRTSKTRAIIDSYYAQPAAVEPAPERKPAKILCAASRLALRQTDNRESVKTSE